MIVNPEDLQRSLGKPVFHQKWKEDELTLQTRLYYIMHGSILHRLMLFLISLDVLILVIQTMLEIHILEKQLHASKHNNEPRVHMEESVMEVLDYVSIVILGIFLLENILIALCLGWEYFKDWRENWIHYFDLSLIITAITLEFLSPLTYSIQEALVFARFWRLMRLGEGVFLVTVEASAHHRRKQEEENVKTDEESSI